MPGNLKKKKHKLGIVAHAFTPAFGKHWQEDLCESEISLVYIVSPKPISAI